MEKPNIDDGEHFGADIPPPAASGLAPIDPAAAIFYSTARADQVLPVPCPATRFPSSVSFIHITPDPINAADHPDFLPFIAASPLLRERAWPPSATSSVPGFQRNHFRTNPAPFSAVPVSQRNYLPSDAAPPLSPEPASFAKGGQKLSANAPAFAPSAAMGIGKGGKQLSADAPAFSPSATMAYMEMHPRFGLKTIICKYWKEGKCPSADSCRFAHGEEELLKVHPRAHRMYQANGTVSEAEAERRARRYKTSMCKKWRAEDPMACPYGVNCLFPHGYQELQINNQLPPVCSFYLAGKACPRDGCRLRHGI